MGKIAFMFAGQGAQYNNMGKELYDSIDDYKNFFDEMNDELDVDLYDVCFNESKLLNLTEYTQPAILTTSLGIANEVSKIVKPDVVVGLSLGEYSALTYAGVIDSKTAVSLVNKRGKIMSNAVDSSVGKLCAIIGLNRDVVEETLQSIDGVTIANYNCPKQYVIGGYINSVEEAKVALKEKGARRLVDLSVSVPSHTPLMSTAATELAKELSNVEFKDPVIEVVMNVSGSANYEDMKDELVKQVSSSVRFEDCIKYMLSEGVDTFIEIGPGKVLSGFVKKTDRSVKIYQVEDLASLSQLKEQIGG